MGKRQIVKNTRNAHQHLEQHGESFNSPSSQHIKMEMPSGFIRPSAYSQGIISKN